jgi:nitroimidazol reductase NimA-like FMN-containing flavoprotein (pyridoxamine 5'-phosphate oxidase superfamily)
MQHICYCNYIAIKHKSKYNQAWRKVICCGQIVLLLASSTSKDRFKRAAYVRKSGSTYSVSSTFHAAKLIARCYVTPRHNACTT